MSADDDLGRWTEDEIDALVGGTVGRIGPDRFEELLHAAMAATEAPPDSDEPPTESAPPSPPHARDRGSAGVTRSSQAGRWLAAAAVVVVFGFAGIMANGAGPDTEVASDQTRPSTTRGDVADSPSTAAASIPVSTQPADPPPGPCRLSGVADAVPRLISCAIPVTATTSGSPTRADATVLVTDDALVRGLAADGAQAGRTCVEVRSASSELVTFSDSCDGRGLRAASTALGSFAIEVRLRVCAAALAPTASPQDCGPPDPTPAVRIVVEVGL